MAYANSIRAAGGSFTDRISSVAKSIRLTLARRRMFGQTLRELSALTDRELSDLGMHRADIRRIAAEAAYGK